MTDTEIPPADERRDPPFDAGERDMLDAWLDFHRATLLMKCEGLTDDQLKSRSVPPSSLSLLGLVRHMTEVERYWFSWVLRGEDAEPLYWSKSNQDGDFDDVDTADVAADMARFRDEIEQCRRVTSAHPDLDVVGKRARHGDPVTLRWIYVHMIEEYARHNGHADLLRERIDGVTGD
jgi:hypothetical protein